MKLSPQAGPVGLHLHWPLLRLGAHRAAACFFTCSRSSSSLAKPCLFAAVVMRPHAHERITPCDHAHDIDNEEKKDQQPDDRKNPSETPHRTIHGPQFPPLPLFQEDTLHFLKLTKDWSKSSAIRNSHNIGSDGDFILEIAKPLI